MFIYEGKNFLICSETVLNFHQKLMLIIFKMKIIHIALIQLSSKGFDIQLLSRQTKFHSETILTSLELYSVSYF